VKNGKECHSQTYPQIFSAVDKDLSRLGNRVQTEIEPLGLECEINPPQLMQYDAWGKRVDLVGTH